MPDIAETGDGASQSSASKSEDNINDDDFDEKESLEPWIDWKRRVTHEAVVAMTKVGVPDWAEEQWRRKWRWAGQTSRRNDGRWARILLGWIPNGRRNRGHPKLRWKDELLEFFDEVHKNTGVQHDWRVVAGNRAHWGDLEKEYIDFIFR